MILKIEKYFFTITRINYIFIVDDADLWARTNDFNRPLAYMNQAVSRQHVIADARIWSLVSSREICFE
jgi:hypothetical protein